MSQQPDPAGEREAGERLIERLGEHGVEHVFATFGTDHPTLIAGMARAGTPTPVLAPHEMVAISAAHGYAQASGQPGVVLVHVDVGTANLGAGLHNAARSRAPLLVLAGRTPLTTDGTRPGSRSVFVHWYQDVADQHGSVREYTKWEYDLTSAANVDSAVDRGLDLATAAPAGPTYLTLPREVLREPAPAPSQLEPAESAPTTLGTDARRRLVGQLRAADHPLVVTSYLGRDEAAVPALVSFAETAGVPVVEAAPAFALNFPRDHPLHYGFAAEPHLDAADLLVVADCDVPWVPKRATPREDATVVHVGADPAKPSYPMWEFPADLRVRADTRTVFEDLTAVLAPDTGTGGDGGGTDEARVAARRDRLRAPERHERRREAVPAPDEADRITPALLSRVLGDALAEDAVVVDETVTNTPAVLEHTGRTAPGTYHSYCSSGLGWGLGAAAGVALARPDATVVAAVGDGSFVLGNPVAAVQMVQAYELPYLTVVYDNGGWQAVADAITDQYGEVGFDTTAFTRFNPGTDYAALAEGWGCHGERVSDPATLPGAVDRGLAAVADGTHAVLHVRTD